MTRWLEPLWRDLRYGARSLRRDYTFSATVAGTLTLGIGLVVAWFAIFEAGFLRPWPLPDSDTLVMGSQGVSATEYRFLRERATSLQLVATAPACPIVVIGDDRQSSECEVVSGNYFEVLRVPLARGRGFRADEDVAGTPIPVAVISYELWRARFALSPDTVGTSVILNGLPFTVIGIVAEGSRDRGQQILPRLWLPLASYPLLTDSASEHGDFLLDPAVCCVNLAGRVSQSAATATAELTHLHRQFAGTAGGADRLAVTDTRAINRPWSNSGAVVGGLTIIGVCLVLAAACANAANLQLARGRRRRHEFLIRLSLGATRWQVVRQLLMESAVLTAALSALALGITTMLARILNRLLPQGGSEAGWDFSPDWTVIAFCVLISGLAVLLSGLTPVLRGTGQLASGAAPGKARSWFLFVQVAMSVTLVICATLLARGLQRAGTDDPGFDADRVARVNVTTPGPIPFARRRAETIGRELRRVFDEKGQPIVAQASLARVVAIGTPSGRGNLPAANWVSVSANYFSLLKVPVRAGRLLREDDTPDAVLVNESFAKRVWPTGPVVGETFNAEQPRVVVGVVADVRLTSNLPAPTFYSRGGEGWLYAAREVDTEARVTAAVRAIDPSASVTFEALSATRDRSLGPARFAVGFSWAIALIALTMACAGVFAVVSLVMDERRREIGIRRALGAPSGAVIRLVLKGTGLPLAAGTAGGLILALTAGPLLRAVVVGVAPLDPIAFVVAAAILGATAVAATVFPLRRALRVNPAVTLRID
jgi:predicted permease